MKKSGTLLYPNKSKIINTAGVRVNWTYLECYKTDNEEIRTIEVSEREYGNSGLREYYVLERKDSLLHPEESTINSIFISHVDEKTTRKNLEAYLPKNVLEKVLRK